MKQTHTTNREAPRSKWPPHGRAWRRYYDDARNIVVWSFWAPTRDGAIFGLVEVSEIYITQSGRMYAADLLRQERSAMRDRIRSSTCYQCIHRKMYGCTQGQKAYPCGGPEKCPPSKKRRGYERFATNP